MQTSNPQVNKRWTKLILKAQKKGYIHLKSMQEMDLKNVIRQLQEKEEKMRIMNVYKKWRQMTNLLLTRDKNQMSSKTLKRWHKLILRASRQGLIQLRTLQGVNLSDMISQLKEKEEKMRVMRVLAKWNEFAKALLLRKENKNSRKVNKRWHKLILKCSRMGFLNLRSV